MAISVPPNSEEQAEAVSAEMEQENQIDLVMRTIWDSRTGMAPASDEHWLAVKKNRVHQATLGMIRRDAIHMIESGEFD